MTQSKSIADKIYQECEKKAKKSIEGVKIWEA